LKISTENHQNFLEKNDSIRDSKTIRFVSRFPFTLTVGVKMVTVDEAKSMIVAELKEELKKRGASVQGKKAELLERLLSLLDAEFAEDKKKIIAHDGERVIISEESNDEVQTAEVVPMSPQLITPITEIKGLSSCEQKNDEEQPVEASEEPETDVTAADNAITEPTISEPAFVSTAEGDKMQPSGEKVSEVEQFSSESKHESILSEVYDSLPLNEKIRQNLKKRKEKDDSVVTETFKDSEDNGASHIRIDYFQRPLNVKNLVKWLSDTTGIPVSEENIWVNSIKTHCYIDFSTTRDGEVCIQKVTGLKYPATSTSKLSAHFTNVSTKEAPASAEAAMKPGEWMSVKPKSLKTTDNNETASSSVLGKRKSEETKIMGGNLFKRATANALHQQGSTVTTSPRNVQVPVGSHFTNEKSAEQKSSKYPRMSEQQSPGTQFHVESVLSLDNLFRKTKTLPAIYWLPVDDHIAERRQNIYNRLGGRK
jgi:apoptotic chromatin condensation inducer in the nucleus